MSQATGRIYRIKVYNSGTDRYWKYIPDRSRWIQLATLDENDEKFNWQISPVPGTSNLFTIRPADSLSIGFGAPNPENARKYWGHGFPQGKQDDITQWQIVDPSASGQYSKLKVNNSTGYVLDCRDTSSSACVHFYKDEDDAKNQRWTFQLIKF